MTRATSSFRRAKIAAGLIVVAALSVGEYLSVLQLTGNFNPLVAGELSRSAQPSTTQILCYEKSYGIRTIVNLRGENVGKPWYDADIAEARKLGIAHVDFRMSARRELMQAQAADLIGILARAQKPILVHCQQGADRSGLASALYVAAVASSARPPPKARSPFVTDRSRCR